MIVIIFHDRKKEAQKRKEKKMAIAFFSSTINISKENIISQRMSTSSDEINFCQNYKKHWQNQGIMFSMESFLRNLSDLNVRWVLFASNWFDKCIEMMITSFYEGFQSKSTDRTPTAVYQIIARDTSRFDLQVSGINNRSLNIFD